MKEGEWHKTKRRKLMEQYGDRVASSHDKKDGTVLFFSGRHSKEKAVSEPDLLIFKEGSKKTVEKVIEIEDSDRPKTLIADIFANRLARIYRIGTKNNPPHKLPKNLKIEIYYKNKEPIEAQKSKKMLFLDKILRRKCNNLNFELFPLK